MSINCRLKAIHGSNESIYRLESSCARKNCWRRHPCKIYEWWQRNHAIHQNNKQTSLENKEVEPAEVKFVNFLKSRLTYNIFYCFWMFVNKFFTYLICTHLKKWKVLWSEILIILFLHEDDNIGRFSNLH